MVIYDLFSVSIVLRVPKTMTENLWFFGLLAISDRSPVQNSEEPKNHLVITLASRGYAG